MCKLKSAIILKDRIFMPDYDSHSDMLEELKIKDDYLGASKKFVRAELSPVNGDAFTDVDSWAFKVDQDITPKWFSVDEYKPKMVEAVKEWAKDHIHIGVDGLKISSGKNHYIKDCKNVVIYDSASISYVCGSASISEVCGSASISKVCGSASISEVCDSAMIASSPYSHLCVVTRHNHFCSFWKSNRTCNVCSSEVELWTIVVEECSVTTTFFFC